MHMKVEILFLVHKTKREKLMHTGIKNSLQINILWGKGNQILLSFNCWAEQEKIYKT